MMKVLLMIDCDSCRELFSFSRTASDDTSAWRVHGTNLVRMAIEHGWAESQDCNYHYCPKCADELEEMFQYIP